MPRRRGTVGLGRGPREMKVFQSFRGDKGQRKGKKEEEKRACRRIPRCGLFHHPREEEKRREVVTGNVYSAYTQAPRRTPRLWHTVDISKYLLSAAGLSLSLSHPLDSPSLVLSTNFSSPLLRVNHARILSIPRLIFTQETFSRLHFFSGQTRSSKSVAISRLLSHLQFQLADFSNSDPYFTRTILARTVVDPTENCSTCYFRWRIASFLFSFFFAGTAVCAVTFTELVLILSRLDRPSFVFSLR